MFKETMVSAATRLGLSVGQVSSLEKVEALIAALHPVMSGHPLIRFGEEADGGYLVPDDLEGIKAIFSPGVDVRASFEAQFLARDIPCYLCDASVERAPIQHPDLEFTRKFIGVVSDDETLTMDEWVHSRAGSDGELLLQMDIEGNEWPVLLNMSEDVLKRFRIIVIELHHMERLFDRHGFLIINAALRRVLQHFAVVHNHPNNYQETVSHGGIVVPRVIELTFLRRDRIRAEGFADTFPHPLDRPNAAWLPDLVLPSQWYRKGTDPA